MTNIKKMEPYLQHNQVTTNAKHSHVRYTGWLCFCQRLPVGSETGRAVNESTVFLEPLGDMFLPLQSSYWCRIKSRQQSQIWVEVVYLAKVFHNLDKLDHIALPVLGFILLQNPWPCPSQVKINTVTHQQACNMHMRVFKLLIWTFIKTTWHCILSWSAQLISSHLISMSSTSMLSCQCHNSLSSTPQWH